MHFHVCVCVFRRVCSHAIYYMATFFLLAESLNQSQDMRHTSLSSYDDLHNLRFSQIDFLRKTSFLVYIVVVVPSRKTSLCVCVSTNASRRKEIASDDTGSMVK